MIIQNLEQKLNAIEKIIRQKQQNRMMIDSPQIQKPIKKTNKSNENLNFLPIELAIKYYTKWDCDIQLKQTSTCYYKCLQGYGQVEFTNGNKFKGHFFNGLMHGDGQFIWNDKLVYKGPFFMNSITGNGQYNWTDGSSYKGDLLNGKKHGRGYYYCANDKSKYEGEWQHNVRHGHGLLQFNAQSYYQGNFLSGLRHGHGKMKYSSGNTYQGQWLQDKKNGYGVMNWFSQNQKYEGEWKNDNQHGLGSYFWFDGKIQYKIVKNIYKGYWEKGQRKGYGSFFYSNGCRYEGYFDSDRKNGYGLILDQNGNMKLQYFQKNKLISSIPESNMNNIFTQAPSNNAEVSLVAKSPSKQAHIIKRSVHQKKKQVKVLTPKLPELTQSKAIKPTPIQASKQPLGTNRNPSKQNKIKVQDNFYSKCLDVTINNDNLDKGILNFLLRENSKIRNWYKFCAQNNQSQQQEGYSGLIIESLWKLVKDLKVIDHYVTIPKLNQLFFKGWKSSYDVVLPSSDKIQYAKHYLLSIQKNSTGEINWSQHFDNEKVNYTNIEWHNYCQRLTNQSQVSTNQAFDQIQLNPVNQYHNPKRLILFRHFVCFLLKLVLLQTQKDYSIKSAQFSSNYRINLQKLFRTITNLFQGNQKFAITGMSADNITHVSKEKSNIISVQYQHINQQLWALLVENQQQFNNVKDNTILFKTLYHLLDKFAIIKDPTEKMLFIQKVQRNMENEYKITLLRKQMKANFIQLQKVVNESPYFQRIMNYPLIQKQFNDLLYLSVNRRIHSITKQDSIKKYTQIIILMKNSITQQSNTLKKFLLPKKRLIKTKKDMQRQQLVMKYQQEQKVKLQQKKILLQLEQQQRERLMMEREDVKWDLDDEQDSQEYFD